MNRCIHNGITHQYKESNSKQNNQPSYPLFLCSLYILAICSELQNLYEPRRLPETKRYSNTQLQSPVYRTKAWIHLHCLAAGFRSQIATADAHTSHSIVTGCKFTTATWLKDESLQPATRQSIQGRTGFARAVHLSSFSPTC